MAKKKVKKYPLKKGMTTLTIQLPKSLHQRMKSRRAKTGIMIREFAIDAFEKALKRAA